MQKILIESERLKIRTYVREDVERLFPMIKDNWELTKYMLWNPPSEIEDFDSWHRTKHDCVIEMDENVVGRASIREIDLEKKSADFGYWIHQNYQGKGLGTELLRALIGYCETELGVEKITAKTFIENIASQKLLEKVGFVQTAFLKDAIEKNGKEFDEYLYEYRSKKKSSGL